MPKTWGALLQYIPKFFIMSLYTGVSITGAWGPLKVHNDCTGGP